MTADDAIRRAERYLETADLVREDGDLETCASRAYYAAFYVAREWLQQIGVETGTHQNLFCERIRSRDTVVDAAK